MPSDNTLKTFKNSQANVQIRTEGEKVLEGRYLVDVFAQDMVNQTYDTLQKDETFNTKGVLSNLKDVLLSKINGESSFLKESEIDALEVKTPATIKNHKPDRKECKARKKAYKEQYKIIKQLEKKDDLTTAEVKAVEKNLLALEGYEQDTELNDLTDAKYLYLAEKEGEIELTDSGDKLSTYFIKHSELKDIYQNFDYNKIEKEIEINLGKYEHFIKDLESISYDLPGVESEVTSYYQSLENYRKDYKAIKESDPNTDKRLRIMVLNRATNMACVRITQKSLATSYNKKTRRNFIKKYGINLAKKEGYHDEQYDFRNHLESIHTSMVSVCKTYVKNMFTEMTDYLEPFSETDETIANIVHAVSKVNEYYNKIDNVNTSSFDYLLDLIDAFDNEVPALLQKKFSNYDSLSNYINNFK